MSRRDLAASIIRDQLTELDASVRIIWFMHRVERTAEVPLDDVTGFFSDHAISTPNRSRLQSKLLADKRVLKGSALGHVRLRATELVLLDEELSLLSASAGASDELAGIEYHGIAGTSRDCQTAVMRLLQCREHIASARILTCGRDHCLLLCTGIGDQIAVKSGFASGYGGEGPTSFSLTLEFLRAHGVEIDECDVGEDIICRIDGSCLTRADLSAIEAARIVRPSRWYQYLLTQHQDNARIWGEFPPIVPLSIIDARLIDLALGFWEGPDERLLKAYRRLEDAVRARTGFKDHGTKLFAKALGPPSGVLTWKDIDEGERTGRYQLFTAAYMAHRNPRAHREMRCYSDGQLSEFLLLNHLFRLEQEACLASEVDVGAKVTT